MSILMGKFWQNLLENKLCSCKQFLDYYYQLVNRKYLQLCICG